MTGVIEFIEEAMPVLISSAGVSGSVFAVICCFLLKRAKNDAKEKQEERIKLEILRLEGEETLSELIIALVRHAQGRGSEEDLNMAEKKYLEYLESNRQIKNSIIGQYTSNNG